MFLNVIEHHKKNWVVKHDFIRSGRTVSKHFHAALDAIILCYKMFLARPTPIGDDCTDGRWRFFKVTTLEHRCCFGALDETFIDVRVGEEDKGSYRTQKGHVAVNVLSVCNPNMQFIYILIDWEGSAADSRVLRDALNRQNRLRVHTVFVVAKLDPYAKSMHYKSWPFFPAWREIFGKDRAAGDVANDTNGVASEIHQERNNRTDDYYIPTTEWNPGTGFIGVEVEPPLSSNMNVDPMVNSSSATKRTDTSLRKRKGGNPLA
ncbi:UNVERIFIED_CONTAM: hypothetical protein Sradi_3597500 [Sesamum radiatum]|uniref:DDE Tnp4 domain-containing protein n=1 Tax=Sesamum radiatum TaxID=300843 RepID=A0AAW2QHD3_SESRA